MYKPRLPPDILCSLCDCHVFKIKRSLHCTVTCYLLSSKLRLPVATSPIFFEYHESEFNLMLDRRQEESYPLLRKCEFGEKRVYSTFPLSFCKKMDWMQEMKLQETVQLNFCFFLFPCLYFRSITKLAAKLLCLSKQPAVLKKSTSSFFKVNLESSISRDEPLKRPFCLPELPLSTSYCKNSKASAGL